MSLFRRFKDLFEKSAEDMIPSEQETESRGARPFLRQLIKDYRRQTFGKRMLGGEINPAQFDAGEAILELAPELQVECAVEISAQLVKLGGAPNSFSRGGALKALLGRFYRRSLPFSEADFLAILGSISKRFRFDSLNHYIYPLAGLLGRMEAAFEKEPVPDSLKPKLIWLRDKLYRPDYTYAEDMKLVNRVENLLRAQAFEEIDNEEAFPAVVDAWTAKLAESLKEMPAEDRRLWVPLLLHWSQASSARPTKKYRKEAQTAIDEVGRDTMRHLASTVLNAVGKAGPAMISPTGYAEDKNDTLIHDRYADHLRGLIWYAVEVADPEIVGLLAGAADRCFRKIPGQGPRSSKIGNACVVALGETRMTEAVGRLTRLKNSVNYASARNQIEAAIKRAAESLGLSTTEMEEVSVPSLGLTQPGLYSESVEDFEAEITFTGSADVKLRWKKPDGKRQVSVPKVLKETKADEVKRLRALVREISDQLDGQQKRIERLFFFETSWKYVEWKKRYWDHPLVHVIASRLIWNVVGEDSPGSGTTVFRIGDVFINKEGKDLPEPAPESRVELWHPVEAEQEEIEAWRKFLAHHQITQPFKQAHREVYRVGEEERATRTYSTRMAGHVLRQHQFAALCQQRRWKYRIMGGWDSANTPTLSLPEVEMTAEFEVDASKDNHLSEYQVFVNVVTDRVRLFRNREEGAVVLKSVSRRLFSEVMRDVDLFVSVCGLARDPDWVDPGPDDPHFEYWKRERERGLSTAGETRARTIAALLQGSTLWEVCEISGVNLVVRGKLRTYTIHLESAHVHMTPKNSRLFIESTKLRPKKSAEQWRMPYEGDSVLVEILNKASLLADDETIKDATLKAQIAAG